MSGRGSNTESILNYIDSKKLNFNVKIIICNNKGALGIEMLKKYNFNNKVLDVKSYNNTKEYNLDLEKNLDPQRDELLILCGYMSKVPDHIIKSYNGNIINIHPSLLPKYKGLNTHEKVINNNEKFHGCSTHFVTSNIDDGPIIAQYSIPINDKDDANSISEKLLPFEHKLYFKTLKMIEEKRIRLSNNKIIFDDKILNQPILFS